MRIFSDFISSHVSIHNLFQVGNRVLKADKSESAEIKHMVDSEIDNILKVVYIVLFCMDNHIDNN